MSASLVKSTSASGKLAKLWYITGSQTVFDFLGCFVSSKLISKFEVCETEFSHCMHVRMCSVQSSITRLLSIVTFLMWRYVTFVKYVPTNLVALAHAFYSAQSWGIICNTFKLMDPVI